MSQSPIAAQFDRLLSISDQYRQSLITELSFAFDAIFSNVPEGLSINITWTQYTPYFNDGEECSFSVNSCDVYLMSGDEEVCYLNSYTPPTVSPDIISPGMLTHLHQTSRELEKKWAPLPESLMMLLFGDHVSVTYKTGEFEVEEYDHE